MTIKPKIASSAKSLDEAICETRAEERFRIADVFASPIANGREQLAVKLITTTPLSAKAILGILGDVPKVGATNFFAAMAQEGSVGISSPIAAATNDDPKSARLSELKQTATQHAVARGYVSAEKLKA
ncbi:hypothetical protein [Methylocystis sp.]|uniref:hypothetical protein n=1 Tax=Methylocystis sp. TaxID=1911079 RepID=UPI003DA21255